MGALLTRLYGIDQATPYGFKFSGITLWLLAADAGVQQIIDSFNPNCPRWLAHSTLLGTAHLIRTSCLLRFHTHCHLLDCRLDRCTDDTSTGSDGCDVPGCSGCFGVNVGNKGHRDVGASTGRIFLRGGFVGAARAPPSASFCLISSARRFITGVGFSQSSVDLA